MKRILFSMITVFSFSVAQATIDPILKYKTQYDQQGIDIIEKMELLYTHAAIDQAVDQMARSIEKKLKDKKPILINVMNGGSVIMADLMKKLNFPLEMDSLNASRYHGHDENAQAKQKLTWYHKPKASLKNRVLLIVDDVLDEGITLAEIVAFCKAQGARAVYTAVLVEKQRQRPKHAIQSTDFKALKSPDYFLVGYGMDYKNLFRNVPNIYTIKTS